ncbi:helix-turn-helix transcriptional regulator [Methanocella paludicola]|nr:hypothetical protein [Methanocella paludicola]
MHRKRPALIIFFITALFITILPLSALADSTIHGRVYDWSTFKPIDVAVVEINTTPVQKVVTTDGNYSFSMAGGEYAIIAEARTSTGPLSARENITVPGSGDFVIDLLLFPADDLAILKDLNESLPVTADGGTTENQGWLLPFIVVLATAILLAAGGIYLLMKKRRPIKPEPQQESVPAAPDATPAPVSMDATGRVLRQDCKDVLSAIAKNGGRMTQLELRKALPYSEVKISLIASELEDAGLLRKVKKGRGNILILTQTGPTKADESTAENKEKQD